MVQIPYNCNLYVRKCQFRRDRCCLPNYRAQDCFLVYTPSRDYETLDIVKGAKFQKNQTQLISVYRAFSVPFHLESDDE